MNNIVYLATTSGCQGCEIMKNILDKVYHDNLYTFSVYIMDFRDLPDWIKINVPLNDFPMLIFVRNNTIKYHIDGTINAKRLQSIINDIGFN